MGSHLTFNIILKKSRANFVDYFLFFLYLSRTPIVIIMLLLLCGSKAEIYCLNNNLVGELLINVWRH